MKSTIYNGVIRLLEKPIVVNGKPYPFAFDSDIPEDLHTSFRVVTTTDPSAHTNESLGEMIDDSKHRKLMADLEKFEGRPLSWLVVHPESAKGSGSTGGARRAQFEKGPDLEPTKAKAKEPEKARERAPSREKEMEPVPPEPEPELPHRGPEPGTF